MSGPRSPSVTLISDASSTVIGKLLESGKTGDIVGQAGRRPGHAQHRLRGGHRHRRGGLHRGPRAGGRHQLAVPPGLVVGSVVDVERDANDVVQTAFLAPAADLDSFELALVITDYEGGLPPVDEQPVPCGVGGHGARGRGAVLHAGPRANAHPQADRQAQRQAVGGRPVDPVVALVGLYRVAGSLLVLRWPFWGAHRGDPVRPAATCCCSTCSSRYGGWPGFDGYQAFDKWADQVYLAAFLVVALRDFAPGPGWSRRRCGCTGSWGSSGSRPA